MNRFCSNCGKQAHPEDLFCPMCGHKLLDEEAVIRDTDSKDIPQKEITLKRVLQEEVSQEEIRQEEVFQEEVSQEEIPQEEISKKEITYKEVTHDELINKETLPQASKIQRLRDLPLGYVAIAIELILVIAVILGGISLINSKTSPEYIIRQYYTGLQSSNYQQAYANLAKSQEAFVTITDFVNAVKEDSWEDTTIQEIQVQDEVDGEYVEALVKIKDTQSSKIQTKEIKLMKAGNTGVFWPKWRIASELLRENYNIQTPVETKVYVNEILLTEENTLIQQEENRILYTIPKVFRGKYKIRLESDIYENAESIVDTSVEKEYKVTHLEIKEDTKKLLDDKAKSDFDNLWQSIYTYKPYEQTNFPKESYESKETYENMGKNRVPHGYRYIDCVAYADYLYTEEIITEDGKIYAQVQVDALRAFSGKYYYFAIIPTDKIGRDTCVVKFIYEYNKGNGKWELSAMLNL